MAFPSFYNPERVGQLYAPASSLAMDVGQSNPDNLSQTSLRTLLILVDMQVDFVHTDGALSIPGAVDDTRRIIEWIFRNVSQITTIAASLDSHLPISIFFPGWWVNADGNHPAPYTVIRSSDVRDGYWRPLYEPEWSHAYCSELEARSKKELMIWPYHTLIGTPGQALTPALYEAIAYHAAACQTQLVFLQKGSISKTEYYSMLEPEVKIPDDPTGNVNITFLKMMTEYDRVYIAGEAKSHCVLETVNSIMRFFADQPEMLGKFHILEDCMSSVAHPTIDFDALADQALAQYPQLHRVKSTDPLE